MYPVCRFEIALSAALFSRWLVKILKSHFPVLILCIFLYTLHYACDYKCSIRPSIFSELLDKCFMRSSAWKHHRAIQRKSLEHFKVNIVFEDRHKCFNCANNYLYNCTCYNNCLYCSIQLKMGSILIWIVW